MGLEEQLRYDANLTLEEECRRYTGYDLETAREINREVIALKRKSNLYEKSIRESYTGDLASQLGYSKAEYLERAKEFQLYIQQLHQYAEDHNTK